MAELVVPGRLVMGKAEPNSGAKVVFDEVRALKQKIEKLQSQVDGIEVMVRHVRDLLLDGKETGV